MILKLFSNFQIFRRSFDHDLFSWLISYVVHVINQPLNHQLDFIIIVEILKISKYLKFWIQRAPRIIWNHIPLRNWFIILKFSKSIRHRALAVWHPGHVGLCDAAKAVRQWLNAETQSRVCESSRWTLIENAEKIHPKNSAKSSNQECWDSTIE